MRAQINSAVRRWLRDVYLGDAGRPADDGNAAELSPAARPWHVDEGGKLALVSTVTMLFFVILIAFIGNAGVAIKRKMDLQNAADSAAYSTALWMARGMNSVTVANHMLGEATALMTILDSFGGKLLAEGGRANSSESSSFNAQIKTFAAMAYCRGPAMRSSLTSVDQPLVEKIRDELTKDNGSHTAAATFFDAQLTLKYVTVVSFTMKTVANIVADATFWIPFGIGPAIEGACIGIHTTISAGILTRVFLEWEALKAMETVIGAAQQSRPAIRDALIPALVLYADTVAGKAAGGLGGQAGGVLGSSGPINTAAQNTLNDLQEQFGQGIRLATFPASNKLQLPLVEEPAPTKGAVNEMPPSEWTKKFTEDPIFTGVKAAYDALFGRIDDALEVVGDVLGAISGIVSALGDLVGVDTGVLERAIDGLEKAADAFKPLPQEPDYDHGFASNPSQDRASQYRLPEFDWQAERNSQWVRATYPYVNSFRGPIYKLLITYGKLSAAGHYYVHWSYRYTLANSYLIRSGEDGQAAHMLVIQPYDRENKGYEPWTTDATAAERMFTVSAIAQRDRAGAHFAGAIYSDNNTRGNLAVGTAMFYNANGRDVPAGGPQKSAEQRNTGWDTLNWLPPVKAPEWGDHPLDQRELSPVAVFTDDLSAGPTARVQINWQAKLIPITAEGRLPSALSEGIDDPTSNLDGNGRDLLRQVRQRPTLLQH